VLRASIETVRERPVALHGRDERVRLILRLEHDGHAGFGEASPLAGFSPDTLEDAARDLARTDWREISLEGDVLGALSALSIASPAARFAIETAVLDLVSRARGRRLVDLLGGPRTAALPLARLALADRSAIDAARSGVAAIKLKLGRAALDRELEGAMALRESAPAVAIRLDANRRLGGRELQRFAAIDPELVEEPSDFEGLTLPVALDETLSREDGEARLRELASSVVKYAVLKPTTLGLTRTLALARVAESLGVRVVVSHTVEGAIGFLACVHVAFACMDGSVAAGLHPHEGLDASRLACFDGTRLHPPGGAPP
jgi:O-succinylbenzoate synthase